MVLHLTWLKMGDTRVLIDLFLKKCDLWRATTPNPVNISDTFSKIEFTAALQHLKPGKAPGPDFICSELISHAGTDSKLELGDFLSAGIDLKFPRSGEEHVVVIINPRKPIEDQESY